MPWYLFALVDAVPSGSPGKGLTGTLGVRKVPGGLAVVERRADVPPMEFGTLQKHQAVVARLSERVPAILPVRFGTLLEGDEIEEVLQDRDTEIEEAFVLVRQRVQFSWRLKRKETKEVKKTKERLRDPRGEAETGTEYLVRAARAHNPNPPAIFRALRAKVAPLVAAERYQPATAQLPASLYHLVDRSSVERYQVIGEAIVHANPALRLSGPFPPFAFVPEIL